MSSDVRSLLRSRTFFIEVEALNTLLAPAKSAVKALEYKSTTLADCFIELIKLSWRIRSLPPVSDMEFRATCFELFNKRWDQFDISLYALAYQLHPYYRGN